MFSRDEMVKNSKFTTSSITMELDNEEWDSTKLDDKEVDNEELEEAQSSTSTLVYHLE